MIDNMPHLSPLICFNLTVILSSIGLSISSFEIVYSKEDYSSSGISSWSILRLRSYLLKLPLLLNILDSLFHKNGFLLLIRVRIISLMWLFYSILSDDDIRIPLSIILITILLTNFRSSYGCDGSDQMFTLVFFSTWIASLAGEKSLYSYSLLFIGCQASLSYAVSGVTKAFGEQWRNGVAVKEILNNQTYGNRKVSSLLIDNLWVSGFLSYGTILFETIFPLFLILPTSYLFIALCLGVSFHASIALTMGLNTFFWAFVSTYPAIIYTSKAMRNLLYTFNLC